MIKTVKTYKCILLYFFNQFRIHELSIKIFSHIVVSNLTNYLLKYCQICMLCTE